MNLTKVLRFAFLPKTLKRTRHISPTKAKFFFIFYLIGSLRKYAHREHSLQQHQPIRGPAKTTAFGTFYEFSQTKHTLTFSFVDAQKFCHI